MSLACNRIPLRFTFIIFGQDALDNVVPRKVLTVFPAISLRRLYPERLIHLIQSSLCVLLWSHARVRLDVGRWLRVN